MILDSPFLCLGTADGSLYVFDVPSKGNSVKLQEMIRAHACSVTDLHAHGDDMASCDDLGNIIIWKAGGVFTKVLEIKGSGYVEQSWLCCNRFDKYSNN